MTVRTTAKTTFSIAVFLFALRYLLNNYSGLLHEGFPGSTQQIFLAESRFLMAFHQIGNFYPNFVYYSLIVVLIACIIDVIMNKHIGLGLLSSLNVLFISVTIGIIMLFIQGINLLLLWGIFLALITTTLYITFSKLIITQLKLVGVFNSSFNNSFKGVYQSIKKIIEIESSNDDDIYKGNTVDKLAIYSAASLVAIFTVVSIISLIVYTVTYWQYFFV